MSAEQKLREKSNEDRCELKGELAFGLAWLPLRVLEIVTGLFLIRGLVAILLRFTLGFKRLVTLKLKNSTIELEGEYYLLGRVFRRTETRAPVSGMKGVRIENRGRYAHVLIGVGFLAVGVFVGVQWFVDGLKAGYPYLALVGAIVILAGIAIDLALYIFVPKGKGRSRLLLDLGPWRARVFGITEESAKDFARAVSESWQTRAKPR